MGDEVVILAQPNAITGEFEAKYVVGFVDGIKACVPCYLIEPWGSTLTENNLWINSESGIGGTFSLAINNTLNMSSSLNMSGSQGSAINSVRIPVSAPVIGSKIELSALEATAEHTPSRAPGDSWFSKSYLKVETTAGDFEIIFANTLIGVGEEVDGIGFFSELFSDNVPSTPSESDRVTLVEFVTQVQFGDPGSYVMLASMEIDFVEICPTYL